MMKTRNGSEESTRRNLVRPYARKEAVQTGSANQRRNGEGGGTAHRTQADCSAIGRGRQWGSYSDSFEWATRENNRNIDATVLLQC
jgi:hypothetical protein